MKHSSDAPLQQAQALCGALDQLRELGVDPREACAGLAFGEEDLTPDAMIPFGDGVAFLENCQKLTGLEQFGLLAGARGDHRSFGAIGQLMDSNTLLFLFTSFSFVLLYQATFSWFIPASWTRFPARPISSSTLHPWIMYTSAVFQLSQ